MTDHPASTPGSAEPVRPDVVTVDAWRFAAATALAGADALAVEEPLELRLRGVPPVTLAVLMRTPGHDRELLLGWLNAEALLPDEFDLAPDGENPNVWHLSTPEHQRVAAGAHLGFTSSACGVCGSGSIERLFIRAAAPQWSGAALAPELILSLPPKLLSTQRGFQATGGLHAAGLFSGSGELLCAFEDVGRHNAVDKVVGHRIARHRAGAPPLPRPLPLSDHLLCVSSRAGFEIVQKAVMAGIPVVVTVGAATSLAVETALAFGVTLCAFTRENRFTVYSGPQRLTR